MIHASASIPWLVAELTLTGAAAGAYGLAVLVGRLGDEHDRRLLRSGPPFALLAICLVAALSLARQDPRNQPGGQRPAPEATAAPIVRSLSWGPILLAACAGVTTISARTGPARRRWARLPGCLVDILALGAACLVGSTAGRSLDPGLTVIWQDATWLSPLLLASSCSMGAAILLLLGIGRGVGDPRAVLRLERVDRGAIALQGIGLAGLVLALGDVAPLALGRWPGLLIPTFVIPVGWLLPVAVRTLAGVSGSAIAAALVLLGAIALRVALVGTPAALLTPLR